jgi:hypothetical protein
MSRHWRPEQRSEWTAIENYGAAERKVRGAVVLVVGALVLGLAGGAAWLRWGAAPPDSGPSSAIEWNAVQAVPTRTPDAEDVAWQKRVDDLDNAAAASAQNGAAPVVTPGK